MAARIPSVLASAESLRTIGTVADRFPASMTECFGFEIALREDSPVADFAFLCKPASAGAQVLAGSSGDTLPQALLDHEVWARLCAFGRDWTRSDYPLAATVTHLWLEFDSARQADVPVPCVFLGIHSDAAGDPSRLLGILEMLGYTVSSECLDLLNQCMRVPAFAGTRFDLGLMLSRPTDRIRLVFHRVRNGIREALADLGLSDLDGLDAVWSGLQRLAGSLNVAVDVGRSIGPAIGLECQFTGNVGLDRPRWAVMLNHLVSLNCCPPATRDALLEWPGGTIERFDHRLAPTTVVRKVNHVKVVWQHGAPLRAKAYLLARGF